MLSRLSVIFYIFLSLEVGLALAILPWWQPDGLGDWAENYFLVSLVHQTGWLGLQRAIASGWVRGAVTGLGLINIFMALWEMAHFRRTVSALDGADERARANLAARRRNNFAPESAADETPAANRAVSDYRRLDDRAAAVKRDERER